MANEDDDYLPIENESGRVLGMGVGTFVLFLMFLCFIAAWTLSIPCQRVPKLWTRWCSLLIFSITSLLLIFAQRETRETLVEFAPVTYEENLPAKLAVAIFMICSTIASVIVIIFGPASDSFLTTSNEIEASTLWAD